MILYFDKILIRNKRIGTEILNQKIKRNRIFKKN